jgi:DNA-binding winged helix-turn-helix (wHTH) protein/tetratricopeptide (TPR) repeat protein
VPQEASTPSPLPGDFTLGDWLIQPSLGRISRADTVVKLRPQLVDLLVCFARHPGRTLTKAEILDTVWPGQYIMESGLGRCITELRQVLGDDAQAPRFIETIPKRGYRLIAPVQWRDAPSPVVAPSPAATPPPVAAPAPEAAPMTPVESVAPATPVPASPPRVRRPALWAALAVLCVAGVAAVVVWQATTRVPPGERGAVVVVFENSTGDAVFDGALGLALAIQLEQSPFLTVLPDTRVREELRFMGRPASERLTRTLALEACQRAGAKALLAGSVAALGGRYVIGLEGVECQSGAVVARQQVEIGRKEDVLDGLGRAASSIRQRLGESLASIRRYDVPVIRATTASLEALKAVSLGDVERAQGRDAQAIQLYQQALDLDPGFALAHARLGVHLLNMGRHGEAVESLKRAFALADRVSVPERYNITGFYYSRVLRDPFRAIEAFQTWRDLYPRDPLPRMAMASLYTQTGRFEKALEEGREAERLDPKHAMAHAVIVEALLSLGRFDEARREGDTLVAGNLANANVHIMLFKIAFVRGDVDGLRRELEWVAGHREAEPSFLGGRAGAAAFSGKLASADQFLQQASAIAESRGDAIGAAMPLLDDAEAHALTGHTQKALELVARALAKSRAPLPLLDAAIVLGFAGDAAGADRLVAEYQRTASPDPASDPDSRPVVSALISLQRERPDAAIEGLAPVRPFEAGSRFALRPALVRGLALAQAGRAAEAASEFQRIVDQRGAVPVDVIYPVAHLHLARALAASGDAEGSRRACQALLAFWKDADPDLPALDQARRGCAETSSGVIRKTSSRR